MKSFVLSEKVSSASNQQITIYIESIKWSPLFCQKKFLAHQINKSQFILKVSSEVLCCQNKFLRAWNKHITIYIERIKRLSPLFCKWVPHATNRNQDCLNILKGIKGSPSFVPWGLSLSRSFLLKAIVQAVAWKCICCLTFSLLINILSVILVILSLLSWCRHPVKLTCT